MHRVIPAIVSAFSFSLYIAGVSLTYWSVQGDLHYGLWKLCYADICIDINNVPKDHQYASLWNTVQAFGIIATVFGSLTFLANLCLCFSYITTRLPAYTKKGVAALNAFTALCGAVTMGVWIGINSYYLDLYYAESFYLFTIGWAVSLINAVCTACSTVVTAEGDSDVQTSKYRTLLA